MLSKTVVILASALLAVAGPLRGRQAGPGCIPRPPKTSTPAAPTLPLTAGAKELPQPPAGTVIKHIALGYGIQNYSCAAVGSSPTAKGALAVLYDATPLYPGAGPDGLSTIEDFQALTTNVLWMGKVPLSLNASVEGRVDPAALGASLTAPFLEPADLSLPNFKPIKYLGQHFFDFSGTPRFDVPDGLFLGNKTDQAAAPAGADKGPMNTGTIAWLQLSALPGSNGISFVYRVTTAGGSGHACTVAGLDSVPYTAMYWFFGPDADAPAAPVRRS